MKFVYYGLRRKNLISKQKQWFHDCNYQTWTHTFNRDCLSPSLSYYNKIKKKYEKIDKNYQYDIFEFHLIRMGRLVGEAHHKDLGGEA